MIRILKNHLEFWIGIDYTFEFQRHIEVVLEDQWSLENTVSKVRLIIDLSFGSWNLFSLD
jgi:hypothetical protein